MVSNLLAAADVWRTIGSVLLAIFILLVMITIHEFGHYLAGKLLGFKIDEFAIGFGPALFKKKRKKTDEIFSLRIIPLGGYCAFHGEDGLEEEKPDPFIEGGAKEEPFAELEAPNEVSKEEVKEEIPTPSAQKRQDVGAFTKMPCWKRIIVLVAGALMNYVLALLLITVCMLSYGQTMSAVYTMETEDVPQEYIAYGLHDFDILLEAEGRSLYLTTDLAKAINKKNAGDEVELRVSRAIDFEWVTDSETGEIRGRFDHREEMTVSIMLRTDVNVKNSADVESIWSALGIKEAASASYRFGFFETLGRSIVYSFKIAGSIFKVIGELLTGHLGISALGGPVSTITMTSKIAGTSFRGFLEIAGFIGVNLAVFNLLPIPALDGSKVVFTVIEWIRGKPISRKVEAIIHAVGFVLLIGFAILVDVLQFVL